MRARQMAAEETAAAPTGRITRRQDFLAANSGVRVPLPPFILLVKQGSQPGPRAGFTVSRRVGNAVTRNRARRRLREAVRIAMPQHAVAGADHIFIARPQQRELPFAELLAFVEQGLGKAKRRLGAAG